MAKREAKSKTDGDNRVGPQSEREAFVYMIQLKSYIAKHEGEFIRAENSSVHLVIGARRIPLTFDRDNYALAGLMLDACGVGSLTQGAQAAIQRMQVVAHTQASGMTLRYFSALSVDHGRLYIPLAGGQLLLITPSGLKVVPNGRNDDRVWVEHPTDSPLKCQSTGVSQGLQLFEQLLVETQSCRIPAMRWFVAMHEGFFPYVRDLCRARFLLVHIGGTQQGKTTGAQRFTQLHGLGEVKGDYSVAALANMPDSGLLVMDNREQTNLNQDLIDYCLFLATGAERGRSSKDGKIRTSSSRPVAVITSIEGVHKPELQTRCVEVEYAIGRTKVDRDDTEDQILEHRNEILSAIAKVFQAWLGLGEKRKGRLSEACPLPNFERHFQTLSELLCAYAEVSGKQAAWAEGIITEWCKHLKRERSEPENELEYPLLQLLRNVSIDSGDEITVELGVVFGGTSGRLYVTEAAALLDRLRKNYPRGEISLPKNATGLGRRLRTAKFQTLRFLDHELAPSLPQLNRTAQKRPIGLFLPDDAMTATDTLES